MVDEESLLVIFFTLIPADMVVRSIAILMEFNDDSRQGSSTLVSLSYWRPRQITIPEPTVWAPGW
jgi:hypothetical protein